MSAPRLRPRTTAALFFLMAVLVYLDQVMLGAQAPVRFHDIFDSEFPRFFNYGRLAMREGPFAWYPSLAGGMASHATHHGPLYPLALLGALVPSWVIYRALLLGLFALSGYGMYRLLREVLGTEDRLALLGATMFAFGTQTGWFSLLVSFFFHLFPLFYVLVERAPPPGAPGHRRHLVALGLLLLMAYPILGVHFALLHLLLLLLVDEAPDRGRRLVRAALVWSGFALWNAPELVTLLRIVPYAHRGYTPWPAAPWWTVLWDWITVSLRHLSELSLQSLGLPFLCAAPLVMVRSPRVRRLSGILVILALVSATSHSMIKGVLAATFLCRLDLVHVGLGVASVLPLLAVTVVQELRELPWERRALALALAAVGLGLLPAHDFTRLWGIPLRMMNLGALLVAGLWLRDPGKGGASRLRAVLAPLAFLLVAVSMRLHRLVLEIKPYWATVGSFEAIRELAQEHHGETFRVGCLDIHPLVVQLEGLETAGGTAPLFFRRYKELFRLAVAPQLGRPEDAAVYDEHWYHLLLSGETATSLPGHRQGEALDLDVLGLMNVRFLVGHRRREDETGLRLLRETPAREPPPTWGRHLIPLPPERTRRPPVIVYELERWLPRAFLVPRARVLPDGAAVLEALGAASFDELATRAFLEAGEARPEELPADPGAGAAPPVVLARYSPDQLDMELQAPGPSLLLVTSNWHPGWQAEVDGRPARVLRADHSFMAVPIRQAGPHRVTLRFFDPWLPGLYLLQLLGAALALGAMHRLGTTPPGAGS